MMRWLTAGAFTLLLVGIVLVGVLGPPPAKAGGPIAVGGPNLGVQGVPFTWDTSSPISYRPDQGGLGKWDNITARNEVAAMFQVWEDVSTATIAFTQGPLLSSDVDTVPEFNALSCLDKPIVFDEDGSLFDDLGFAAGVIGFAGPCFSTSTSVSRIVGGLAALNGKFIDIIMGNGDLTDDEFRAAFIHEFGHFSGLDHSQINLNCLTAPPCGADDEEGVPTMFPRLLGEFMKTLATDDIAWISNLYPSATFSTSFGTISGTILFSDGVTHAQGVNVIARQVDDSGTPAIDESRRIAVSVVSGFLFTGNPGQSVTGTNPGSSFGGRDPLLIGTFDIPVPPGNYTVEVESIFSIFDVGSSVGPFDFPIPNPGADEFWDLGESATDVTTDSDPVTVTAGITTAGIDIILNGTPTPV
ncbi:hypothetical protein MYX77_11310, partial [Acidobacteriia bacterium AH_259_A11_L15]|nr:hypothetical protein [Acidobacteriia bacterium AH_259_A11_L15]